MRNVMSTERKNVKKCHVFLGKQNNKRNKQKQIETAKTKRHKFRYGCRRHVFGFLNVLKIYV